MANIVDEVTFQFLAIFIIFCQFWAIFGLFLPFFAIFGHFNIIVQGYLSNHIFHPVLLGRLLLTILFIHLDTDFLHNLSIEKSYEEFRILYPVVKQIMPVQNRPMPGIARRNFEMYNRQKTLRIEV